MKQGEKFRVTLFVVLGVAIVLTVVRFRADLTIEEVEAWVSGFGLWGPTVFVGVFSIAPVVFLPGSLFAMVGGALFGPWWGTVYSLVAATMGATMAFLAARYIASDWVSRKAGQKLQGILEGVNERGWRFVAFVRLVPLFPFNVLNYALGLTLIPARHYVTTTFLCMIPGAFAYSYLGYVGREAVGGGGNIVVKGLLAVSLLAALALLPGLLKRSYTSVSGSKKGVISTEELYD